MVTILRCNKRICLDFASLPAVPGIVNVPLGTLAISAGKLKAATLADALNNLIANGEFTADLVPWTPYHATALRVDSAITPGTSPPTLDTWCAQVTWTSSGGGASYVFAGYVPQAQYRNGAYGYAPSADTGVKVWRLVPANKQITVEDAWQWQSAIITAPASGDWYQTLAFGGGPVAGDLSYTDGIVLYRQNALYYILATPAFTGVWYHTMPAALLTPRSALFRYVDALNYWEARMTPGAPGSVKIIEVVAGVETTRATTAVTLSAATEYRLDVRCAGAQVWTYVNGVQAATYAMMATNLTARGVGALFYDTVASLRAMEVKW